MEQMKSFHFRTNMKIFTESLNFKVIKKILNNPELIFDTCKYSKNILFFDCVA